MAKTPKDLRPLVDLDILKYRCGFAADAEIKRKIKEENPGISDPDLWDAMQEIDYAHMVYGNVNTTMEAILERFNPEYRAYVHTGGNYREDVATLREYKGNRDPWHKPKYSKEFVDYVVNKWQALTVEGIESDDAIGIDQCKEGDNSTVIVSIDKDMDMIPGWHFNWVKNNLYFVTQQDADRFFFWQMLVGDTTDNIPGINKIGPKRASALLDPLDSRIAISQAVQDKYREQYGDTWDEAFREVGRLLWILRDPREKASGCPFLYGSAHGE